MSLSTEPVLQDVNICPSLTVAYDSTLSPLGGFAKTTDVTKIQVFTSSMNLDSDTTTRYFKNLNLVFINTVVTPASNRLSCALTLTSTTAVGSPFVWEWYLKTGVVSSHVVPDFKSTFCGGPGVTFTYTTAYSVPSPNQIVFTSPFTYSWLAAVKT